MIPRKTYSKECPKCRGEGIVYDPATQDPVKPCYKCFGRGEITVRLPARYS